MPKVQKLSMFFLLLLFPGTFFYHTALGLGYITPFFGGYISIMCALTAAPLLFIYLIEVLHSRTIKKSDAVFFIFIAVFGLTAGSHALSGLHVENAQNHLLAIVNLLAYYMVFRQINPVDDSFKKALIFSTLAMSSVIFFYSMGGRFSIREYAADPDTVAKYQTFAMAYICPLILSISKCKNLKSRLALFTIGFVSLYLNSARSEFVAIAAFYIIFETSISKYRSITPISIALAGALAVGALLHFNADSASNRVSNLANLSQDGSSNVRDEIAREGIAKIYENPLLGDYGNYEGGFYIHNILSAWQDFGVIGFLYFCFMLLAPLIIFAKKSLLLKDRSRGTALCLAILATTMLLLIFGKHYSYPLVAVALGLAHTVKYIQRPKYTKTACRAFETT